MRSDVIRAVLEESNPWWTNRHSSSLPFPVKRQMFDRLMEYLGERGARRAAVLSGMRQVGKTTLLKQIASTLLTEGWPPTYLTYFDFSDDRLPEEVTVREILEIVPGVSAPDTRPVFLLDEISKAGNWGAWLKQAVDAQVGHLIITDSAASLLRDGAIESAPGRWDPIRLESLSFNEFLRLSDPRSASPIEILRARPNSLERYVALGGFPEHVLADDEALVRERLRISIADRAIRFDLARFGVDTERIRSLFVYLVRDSGAILNVRKRARDIDADERSVRHWIGLLEDAHLITCLERHSGNAAARLRAKPRFYATDHGLISAFTPIASPEGFAAIRGKVIEAVVFRHLREVAGSVGGNLTFYRDDTGVEADFVLDAASGRFVIEATASSDPPQQKLERIRGIAQALHATHAVIVQGGTARQQHVRRVAPVLSLSLAEFLLDPFLVLGDRR